MNNVTRIFQELKSEPDKSNHAQECGPKLASILFSRGSLASSLFSQVQKSPVYGTACISCYGTYHIMTAVRSLFLSASWEKLCSHHPHTQKDCFLKVFRFFVGPDSTVGSHRLVCTTQAATESTMKKPTAVAQLIQVKFAFNCKAVKGSFVSMGFTMPECVQAKLNRHSPMFLCMVRHSAFALV